MQSFPDASRIWSGAETVLLQGAQVCDPGNERDGVQDVLVRKGRIEAVAPEITRPADLRMDLQGLVLAPGFGDLHVHLREPGDEDAETIASGTAAAARGGFVAVASMANTHPTIDDPQSVRFVLERAREAGMSRVYPMAAVSRDLAGKELSEMFDLAEAGAVAFSDDGMTIMDANLMRRALEYAGMLDKVIVTHAEDTTLKGAGVAHEGYMATKLGLGPVPRAAEEVIVDNDEVVKWDF